MFIEVLINIRHIRSLPCSQLSIQSRPEADSVDYNSKNYDPVTTACGGANDK